MDQVQHLMSIDLEDWFHLLDNDETRTPDQWATFPSRVENNTQRLLDLFEKHKTKATFFVLGWMAEKHPDLIRKIQSLGHEIGCHSYAHPLIYNLTKSEFESDLIKSLNIIEDITKEKVTSYRAPGFSITNDCKWAFDILAKNGIKYDSSVFPTERSHGGLPGFPEKPFIIDTVYGNIKEYPISTAVILGKKIVFSGGGYFRLFPYWYISRQFSKHQIKNQPVITYFHPRDIDPKQPVLKLSKVRKFKSYVNLAGTFDKLDKLLSHYNFTNISNIPNT